MEVEGNQSAAAEHPTDSSVSAIKSHAVTMETEIETPTERTDGFGLFSDIPPPMILFPVSPDINKVEGVNK